MKKVGLVLLGGLSAIILLANLGHIVGLAISLIILYFAVRGFYKSDSFSKKTIWVIVGLIAISISASNVPAIIGITAGVVLYYVYKKWHIKDEDSKEETDPFTNFEKQWHDLRKNI